MLLQRLNVVALVIAFMAMTFSGPVAAWSFSSIWEKKVVVEEPQPVTAEQAEPPVADEPEPLAADEPEVKQNFAELYYREVLFDFYQQKYFSALTNLGVSDGFDRLSVSAAEADLLAGGMLLSWGQDREAGEIFERLLANTADSLVRDRSRFFLGKVRFQRGYPEAALREFELINGPLPDELQSERLNLQAQAYMELGRYQDAVNLLGEHADSQSWSYYARYNLGVALLSMGELEQGVLLLEEVGLNNDVDEEYLALRDRANLAIGYVLLQEGDESRAKHALQRIRLNGLSSNKALLGAGWANAAEEDFRKALAPWMELSERDVLDSAVQESLLAVPYAFTRLGAVPQAAEYYARALDVYNAEIQRLDTAISDMENDSFLGKMLGNETSAAGGWYWQLDSLPDEARTRYLYFAIADHQFHEGIKSYRDLLRFRDHFAEWNSRLHIYRDLVSDRSQRISTELSELQDKDIRAELDKMRATQKSLEQRTKQGIADHDVTVFATAGEQDRLERLENLEKAPAWSEPENSKQRQQQRLLKGLLTWELEQGFHERSADQQQELEELESLVTSNANIYEALEINADQSLQRIREQQQRMDELLPRLALLQEKIEAAIESHENYLSGVLRAELKQQRERLVSYRAQAMFSLASVYDRMSAENR